jgi:hypothetical protein
MVQLAPPQSDFAFRDIRKERVRACCRVIDNDLWVTLSSPAACDIPYDAKLFKDVSPDAYPSTCSPTTGRLDRMEWGSSPDWYRRDYHWRAWIPTPMPASWFDIRVGGAGDGSQWDAVGNQYVFTPRFKGSVSQDLMDADAILHQLNKRLREDEQWKAPRVLLPPSPYSINLDGRFKNLSAMAQRLVEVQRHFLELLGAIRWLMGIDADLDANVSFVAADLALDVKKRLAEWGLPQSYGRGVLIDLCRDWREINIPLYLDNGITVHYMWTPAVQADPRFRSLSPSALDAPCPDGIASWAYSDVNAPITTHLADQFLQLRYPMDTAVERTKAQSKMDSFVVDFEGWKARSVTNAQRQRYLKDLWYVELAGPSRSQRVFYRNRPRVNYYDAYSYLNAPAEENLVMIREIWKFSCCPPPFHRYTPPLAMKQEALGSSTIPVDTPMSSLQALPPPPVFEGNPYQDLSDDDEWDSRAVLATHTPKPSMVCNQAVPQDTPTSSLESSSRNTDLPDRMDINDQEREGVRQTLILTPAYPSSRLSNGRSLNNESPIRSASHVHRQNMEACRSYTSTTRRGPCRAPSFPADKDRFSGQHSNWKGKRRDSGRHGYVERVGQHTDNGWGVRTQSYSQDGMPFEDNARRRRLADQPEVTGWGVGAHHEGNLQWGKPVKYDRQDNTAQRENSDLANEPEVCWGTDNWGDARPKDNPEWGQPVYHSWWDITAEGDSWTGHSHGVSPQPRMPQDGGGGQTVDMTCDSQILDAPDNDAVSSTKSPSSSSRKPYEIMKNFG